jgi:hypothetical protein
MAHVEPRLLERHRVRTKPNETEMSSEWISSRAAPGLWHHSEHPDGKKAIDPDDKLAKLGANLVFMAEEHRKALESNGSSK